MSCIRTGLVAVLGVAVSAPALAVVNPFTETFQSPSANWSSGVVLTPLNYPPGGGPDGSGYGSRSADFSANPAGDQPLLFRGQSNFNSSGNAFVGDWIASGVTTFSFSVRHDAPAPVDFFARFAPAGGPGIVAALWLLSPPLPPVQPNTWTTFTIAIDPSTAFVYETTTFAAFSTIARVQVGVLLPAGLAGQAGPFTFDIDNVSITPAPGAAGLAIGVMGLALRRGTRRSDPRMN